MNDKKIADFVIEDKIDAFLAVRRRDVREYARGKFVSMELGDSSGRIGGVMWEPDQFALTDLAEGMVVKVRGVVGEGRAGMAFSTSTDRLFVTRTSP